MSRPQTDLLEPGGKTSHNAKPAQELLGRLIDSSLVLAEDWENLPASARATIRECTDPATLLSSLQEHTLLTDYQVGRIEAGTTHGLILGNYRVLD